MIRIDDKSSCCGCSACQAICPHDAILMRHDAMGFAYPEVNAELCVDCGLCESVCRFSGNAKLSGEPADISCAEVIAARNRDAGLLSGSQSGGIFILLAETVISSGGVVYGAAFDKDFSVSHHRAGTLEECMELRGSKYVQSRMGDVMRDVRADLEQGRSVLFSGTPCQVAGLRSYIPSPLQSSLFLVDFVCHGVPSPAVWKDYVDFMGRKGTIVRAAFRDKSLNGWKEHRESFAYADGSVRTAETFKVLFYKNIMLRDSCGVCPYDMLEKASDITLADFWGVGEVLPEFDGDAGTSMVICNTAAGEKLLAQVMGRMDSRKVTLSKDFLLRRNPNMLRPSHMSPERERFAASYAEKGFLYVARRWGDLGWRYKAWKFKKLLKKLTGSR